MEETPMETDNPVINQMETENPVQNNINGINGKTAEDLTCSQTQEETPLQYPTLFKSKTLLELCNSSWSRAPQAKEDVQPYLRGCKWSPDGTCCLSVVNNDGVHLTELPRELYTGSVVSDRQIDILDSVVHVKEAGLIYDFCWYPGMNSYVPETCCWLTTRQNAPIQMWDAFDGSLRCSYRGFNSVDEMEPALSVTFISDASMIVGGYKKVLRTFDVERPGRDFSEHKISSPASCLTTDRNLLAVGSWNTTITLYNINETGTYKSIGKMHGHAGGVTHMKFAPDGLKLVSGARKDHRLLVWDIRYYRRPLNVLNRAVDTNQRVYFDISSCGRYLVSGGTDGIVTVWKSTVVDWKSELDPTITKHESLKFPLHRDCCNSVSLHPLRPIIATGSGQYHFTDPITSLDTENTTNDTQLKNETNDISVNEIDFELNSNKNTDCNNKYVKSECIELNDKDMRYSSFTENCLVFWWTGEIPDVK